MHVEDAIGTEQNVTS